MIINNFQALEQFEIIGLFSLRIFDTDFFCTFTNFNIELFLSIVILVGFITIFSQTSLIFLATNFSIILEKLLNFIFGILFSQSGRNGIVYFPIILSTFLLILVNNLIGLVPYNFCVTSQIFVTFTLSTCVFVAMIIISIGHQGLDFVWFFVPKNVPKPLLPFIVAIEVVSYISRVFSLAIRLFANMVAGHALLHIISGAVVLGFKKISLIHISLTVLILFPLAILFAIICLEFGVAFLQAYVFVVLFCIYINDCYNHH